MRRPEGSGEASTFLYGAHIRANNIRQHYLRYGGSGPALVVVPGIVSPAALWGFVAERLGRHFDTYVLDVRGRGLSEHGDHLDYGLEACATDVIAFASALLPSPYILLGHSMGARIAIRVARRASPQLERIILVDPPVSGPGRRPYPTPVARALSLLQAAQRGEAEQALRMPGIPAWPEHLLRLRAEWLHTCDERAVIEAHRGFHENDMHADLPHIAVPTALIAAGKGGVILPAEEQEIRELLPSVQVRRVAAAGHQIQVDDYEGFFQALGSVLDMTL
jgi:N-formylmaleamate deformylase